MTSIAATPGYVENLGKRSRCSPTSDIDCTSMEYEYTSTSRHFKRARQHTEFHTIENEDKEVLKYTQRHMEYFDQMKSAEIARIRTEYEQYIMKKDMEIQQIHEINIQLTKQMEQQHKDTERLQYENKILKRGITKQNQQKEAYEAENNMLKQLASQAAEYIKNLEQKNYALQVHLQTSTTPSDTNSFDTPPNVF